MLTRKPDDAQIACKCAKAGFASCVETLRLGVYTACDVDLASAVGELEAVAELHQGVAKKVWNKDNRTTTETMHQDGNIDNVKLEQEQMEIS